MIAQEGLLVALLVAAAVAVESGARYSRSWAVELRGTVADADRMVAKHGLLNHGSIANLDGIYHFETPNGGGQRMLAVTQALLTENEVVRAEQQVYVKRIKRGLLPSDPNWRNQWSLYNTGQSGGPQKMDINVVPAWLQGYTGKGVVVSVVDDGVQSSHVDLASNIDLSASYNFVTMVTSPDPATSADTHGTECAGEIGMVRDNGYCGVGVAYQCNLGGVLLLSDDGEVTDLQEANADGFQNNYVNIYSNSWGPPDDGYYVEGPGSLLQNVLHTNAQKGRGGLGSIWVWASGNGGANGDSCAADGYASSLYTISVGSADQSGNQASYDESCSSKMAVTYSYNSQTFYPATYNQVTTSTFGATICTDTFTGTSASAPLVSGVIALTLQANPTLSWRDVQYLIVYTSNPQHLTSSGGWEWSTNRAGLLVSHQFGFGAIDAEAMVTRARNWIKVPTQQTVTVNANPSTGDATLNGPFVATFNYPATNKVVSFMEHVIVQMTLTMLLDPGQVAYNYNSTSHDNPGPKRGDISVTLTSPGGTTSTLLPLRPLDYINTDGYGDPWPFMSVHYWGESPVGEWSLNVAFASSGASVSVSKLSMQVYGTTATPLAVSRIPASCDPACARGCAAAGSQYCDACREYRIPSTLECVSACPNGSTPLDGYCVNGTADAGGRPSTLSAGEIAGISVGSVAGLLLIIVFGICLIRLCYRRSRDYVPINTHLKQALI